MAVNEHLPDDIFDRYARRETAPLETLEVQTHIAACGACREKLARVLQPEKAFAAVRDNFAFADLTDAPEHLAYEQLEFFAEHKADEVEREIAASHLAICAECSKDLADLQIYRKIAAEAEASATANENLAAAPPKSFWQKLFAFDSIGSFAPVAALLLIALLLGAWFFLTNGKRENEIAEVNRNQAINGNQNQQSANFNAVENPPAPDVSPENSPAPIENPPAGETIYALNDGQLKVDDKGNLTGAENLSPAARNSIKQSIQTGRIAAPNYALGGSGGVLMSGNNSESGVPFGLETPIGKVIKENQPILRWKALKDAESYSVAVVDEKFNVVAESGKLTTTSWKPAKPLPRGANYSWQVTAIKTDGTETISPSSPAPQARFRVIEQNLFDEISRLEKSANRSHLALGVLYAKAGLKKEARAEFEKLAKENPSSPIAQKLLQNVK